MPEEIAINLPEGVLPDVAAGRQDVARLLASLRRQPDQLITNHSGDQVYLKQVTAEESSTGSGYLTDCCFLEVPCERHRP
ncbi:MAG TPA: hypothetical protein VHX38_23950 [Pseudonocardiaceae bacterium]|jgi:hypothetical protein|nr:hypothetical protein [Pseudonocardiaceae bacterium]